MAVLPSLDNLRALLQRVIFVPIVYGFISLLPIFLTGWENSDRLADRLFSTVRSKENMFDFIVVGSGTAGALVANRLAEHYRVLLLEEGGTPMPLQTIPALALKFLNHPQTDWSHKTVPQRNACLNSINQQSSWSAGRGLGGSTNINFMTHVRGNPMDFESWAEATGDPAWSYSSVLPYFKRYETFSGTSNDPEARGHAGELRIRKPSYVGISEDWVRAGQELGYPFVDLNGHHEEGFGILQYPIFKGIRQSTYTSFLLPMHKSPRLTIRRYALVRKVLFRDMNNMAYGVEYVRHGKIETVIATKEVILSAGTLGSSKLLMLSGVGPREHLEELGIPVRSNLPVGRNLQDHLAVHLGPFFIKEPKSFLFDRDVTPENIVRWLFLGTGPITTTGYQGAASIVSSIAKSRGQANWPDLHLILHGQAIHQGYTDAFAYAYGLQEDELMQYYSNAIGRDSFHIYVIGSRPTSTGQVLLSGASISDPLVINPRYLEDGGNGDFKVLMEGVKSALHIANTTTFKRLGAEFTQAKLPGCQELDHGTEAYWECYIRRFTLTMHNPVGTVAMGQVVDSDLRVRGTRGLRVVDASIQPTLVCTGTAASTFMIAEKGVDLILKDYGIPDRDQDLFDVVFGRNGFFKKNPVLKILQREFDTINPLRALFKPFAAATDVNADGDAKERFTRNGRIDNPFLQVFSSVFGNANLPTGDNTMAGSGYVELNENQETGKSLNGSSFQRRSTEDMEPATEDKGNVISKNQWVLQPAVSNNAMWNSKPYSESNSRHLANPQAKAVSSGLKITELTKKKTKGGKRYALLQALLKEAELNATNAKLAKTSNKGAIPLSPTPITKPTVKPVVEVVQFVKPVVNASENEIDVDDAPVKTNNLTNNSNATGGVVAKPILINPSQYGILPISNRPSLFSPPNNFGYNPTPGPLGQLLQSLSSFEAFMRAFTAKDRILITPSPINNGNLFTATQPPPPNIFQTNNNGNAFNFLSAFNNNNANNNNLINNNANNIFAPNNAGGIPTSSVTTNSPFNFLFPVTASVPILPRAINTNQSSAFANTVNFNFTGNNTSNNTTTTRSDNNIFSAWFKPLPKTPSSTSAWFKPLDKPLDKPSISWFKPVNNAKSSASSSSSSWFQPFVLNNDKSKSITTSTTTSWFKPFTFNSQPFFNSASARVSTTPLPPPTGGDPLGGLFELFLGGLKKHERRAVFNTLDSMLQAGEGLADILGAGGSSNNGSTTAKNSQSVNFFEQLAKGILPNITANGTTSDFQSDSDVFLRSMMALNDVLNLQTTTTTSTSEKPTAASASPSSSDDSLEDFLSTFNYPPTETTSATLPVKNNTTIKSDTTTTTTSTIPVVPTK